MRCEQCNCEYEPKRATSRYCSPKCRARAQRLVHLQAGLAHGSDGARVLAHAQAGYELAHARIGSEVYYYPRTRPERLNWGEPMTMDELKDAGLAANRVPIPGDWDYAGAVTDTVTPAVLRQTG